MIKAEIYISKEITDERTICGFKVVNHGDSILCAAMSMLSINTVNSLEALTAARLEYSYNPNGGYIECLLPGILAGEREPEAEILLRSFVMGVTFAQESYKGINLKYEEKSDDFTVSKKTHSKTYMR